MEKVERILFAQPSEQGNEGRPVSFHGVPAQEPTIKEGGFSSVPPKDPPPKEEGFSSVPPKDPPPKEEGFSAT